MIIQLACAVYAHAMDVEANHVGDAQDSRDTLFDKLVSKMADKLFDRLLKPWPLHHAGVDNMTLGKPSQVLTPTSHLAQLSAFPSSSSHTSQVSHPFLVRGQFRSVPKGAAKAPAAMSLRDQSGSIRSPVAVQTSTLVSTVSDPASAEVHTRFDKKHEASAFHNVEKELDNVAVSPLHTSLPPTLHGGLSHNGLGRHESSGKSVHHEYEFQHEDGLEHEIEHEHEYEFENQWLDQPTAR